MSLLLETPTWVTTLTTAMKSLIGPILILAATAGIIYAIVVGVKFVKADDKSARDEAKQKLISVIIGIVVTLLLIAFFYWLAWAMENGKVFNLEKFIEQKDEEEAVIRFITRR